MYKNCSDSRIPRNNYVSHLLIKPTSQLFRPSCTCHVTQKLRNSRRGRNRVGRREKWPKQSREEGEKEKLTFREVGEIGSKSRERGEIDSESREGGEIDSESREKGDLSPCSTPLFKRSLSLNQEPIRSEKLHEC